MNLFYCPDISATHTLPESESSHCCRVMRMRKGDIIYVMDGKGSRYECRITDANPRATEFEVVNVETPSRERDFTITLALSPTKNIDRTEWAIEKAVEMGVDTIIPLKCAHAERKEVKHERLQKVIVSAAKQSLEYQMPDLWEMTDFNKFIESCKSADQKYIAYCSDEFKKELLAQQIELHKNIIILIGPEGDFSKEEVEKAVRAGFLPVSLGEKRLRTETASVFSIAAIHAVNQRSGRVQLTP